MWFLLRFLAEKNIEVPWDILKTTYGLGPDMFYFLLQFTGRMHRNVMRARVVSVLEAQLRSYQNLM